MIFIPENNGNNNWYVWEDEISPTTKHSYRFKPKLILQVEKVKIELLMLVSDFMVKSRL